MRRDLDLVRDILIQVGESNEPVDAATLGNGKPYSLVVYHCLLLEQHGLIDFGTAKKDINGEFLLLRINGLTWGGEDYLAAIADTGIWKKTKAEIAKVAKSVTFDVVKSTAILLVQQQIKTNLNM